MANVHFFKVKAGDAYSHHWALNGNNMRKNINRTKRYDHTSELKEKQSEIQ